MEREKMTDFLLRFRDVTEGPQDGLRESPLAASVQEPRVDFFWRAKSVRPIQTSDVPCWTVVRQWRLRVAGNLPLARYGCHWVSGAPPLRRSPGDKRPRSHSGELYGTIASGPSLAQPPISLRPTDEC